MTAPISKTSHVNLSREPKSEPNIAEPKRRNLVPSAIANSNLRNQDASTSPLKNQISQLNDSEKKENTPLERSIQKVEMQPLPGKRKSNEDRQTEKIKPPMEKSNSLNNMSFSTAHTSFPEANRQSGFDIVQPSSEFYANFINFQGEKKLKSKDSKQFYIAIKGLLHAVLCINNEHFLQKLGEVISQAPSIECAKAVIKQIFKKIEKEFKERDAQCALKFGNALVVVLMNIVKREREKLILENEQKGGAKIEFDMTRLIDSSPAEAVLKSILIEVILADGAAKSVYESILDPLFKDLFAITWFDHYRLVYLDKKLDTKHQNPDDLAIGVKYQITEEGFEKLKSSSMPYHEEIGKRSPEVHEKIWPRGLTFAFKMAWDAIGRFTPNADRKNTKDIPIKLSNGEIINLPAWRVGALTLFGSMCLFSTILKVWMERLKANLNEEFIFDRPELLRESFKKLLFDPNFYLSLLLQQEELKDSILSTEQDYREYTQKHSKYWEKQLTEKLREVSSKTTDKDEKELFDSVDKIIKKHSESLLSPEFEIEFSDAIAKFKTKKIAAKIRLLLKSQSFIDVIQMLPNFKFSEDEKAQANEITLLFNAIMENDPRNLSQLSDKDSARKIEAFLLEWGENLQSILQKKAKINIATTAISLGVFKQSISDRLKKEFNLPVSVDEMPTMLEGLQELPDKNLFDLFKGYANNPDFKLLEKKAVCELLNDAKSPLVDELEMFMLDENLLSAHFNILSDLYPGKKRILETVKSSWSPFIRRVVQLIPDKDFNAAFDKGWKDKTGFRAPLMAIASNSNVYKSYNPLIIYAYFRSFANKLNGTDKIILDEKGYRILEMLLDLPSQTAAKRITGGDSYKVTPAHENDGYLKKLTKPLEIFGAEGEIENSSGEKIFYHQALAEADVSFLRLADKIEEESSSSILRNASNKQRKISQDFLEGEIKSLIAFLNDFPPEGAQAQRERWHNVLRLAIQSGNGNYIKYCLDKIEGLGSLSVQDVRKHFTFISKNLKDVKASWELMQNYFLKKPEYKDCYTLLQQISSDSYQVEKFSKAILGPTLLSFKSNIKTLPPGHVRDFLERVLDPENPLFKNYLQLSSITNTIKLEIMQFGQVLSGDVLLQALTKLGSLNGYFATEVFSDNLTMWMADPQQENTEEYKSKLSALRKFNEIMINRLNGKPTEELSENLKSFSICKHWLVPEKMHDFMRAYQSQLLAKKAVKDVKVVADDMHDIEYSFFPMMKLNIESCHSLLKSLEGHKLYGLLQRGLIDRYSAVNELLYNYKTLSLEKSLEFGRKTPLVVPTLTYSIAIIDQVKPIPKLQEVIDDNSLEAVLEIAGLLVRLTNDIGTIPLFKPEESLKKLKACIKANKSQEDFLTQLKKVAPEEWSRVIKDLKFGEHNVLLDRLHQITDRSKAWKQFETTILDLSKKYQEERKKLIAAIDVMDKKIEDKIPGQLILNFVLFHEDMYKKNADTSEWDYATS